MQDHSVEIQLFFFGSALLSGLEAMKEHRWRAVLLWSITALGILCGIFWSTIKTLSPPIAAFMTSLATNPESWFILTVLGLLWVVISGRSKKHPDPNALALPHNGMPANNDFASRKETDKEFEELWKGYDEQKEQIEFFNTRFGQLDKVVFPPVWDKLREIDKRTAIPPNLGTDFMEAIRSIEGGLQSRLVRDMGELLSTKEAIDRDIKQMRGQMARQDEEILHLLDFASIYTAFVLMGNIVRLAPPVEVSGNVLTEESEERVVEYLSSIQTALANSQYAERFENIIKNAETQTDRKYEQISAHEFPDGITPLIARRRAIVRCKLESTLNWMKDLREAFEGQMAAQRATLTNLLNFHRRY